MHPSSLWPSLLLIVLAGCAAALAAEQAAGPPGGKLLMRGNVTGAASADATGWADNNGGRPSTLTALRPTGDGGTCLEVTVDGAADLYLKDLLPMRKGKVYRIEVDGRVEGQVEQIKVEFRGNRVGGMPPQKFSWVSWPIEREWTRYVVQARQNPKDNPMCLRLHFQGAGVFQLRSYRVAELDAFDLPVDPVPPRGELLPNGDFALAGTDWVFRASRPGAAEAAPAVGGLVTAVGGGQASVGFPAGGNDTLTCGRDLRLRFGQRYVATVHGQAAAGELILQLLRPGMAAVNAQNHELVFADGVASVAFEQALPASGALVEAEYRCALRLRHKGDSEARVSAISFREDGPAAPELERVAAVEVSTAAPTGHVAVLGSPVTLRIRTRGLSEGEWLNLRICNERAAPVRTLELVVGRLADGATGGELTLADLPPGWFTVSVAGTGKPLTCVSDDLAILLPPDPRMQRSGFLGAHFGRSSDPAYYALAALLGMRELRIWDFNWPAMQPSAGGAIASPRPQLDLYLKAGLRPMVILTGTPAWASTAPDGSPMATTYQPKSLADWEAYVRAVVTACGTDVSWYEIWNEPNLSLKAAPGGKTSLETAYTDLVRSAYPIIKTINPAATVVGGATAGPAGGFFVSSFKAGLLEVCDALSYHAYGEAGKASQGAAAFQPNLDYLRKQQAVYKQAKPVIDSESGYNIADGGDGLLGAMTLAQGLVARQAAGFARTYVYNAYTREFPGHTNFAMVLGFNERPLVSVPMIATWDRILGDATYEATVIDETPGSHVYRFKRRDGRPVFAGWSTAKPPVATCAQDQLAQPVCLDAFGRPVAMTSGPALALDGGLRYYIPADLLPTLGLPER